MSIIKESSHPIWGEIVLREDEEQWEVSEVHFWENVGKIEVRFSIPDLESSVVQDNFLSIRNRWEEIWSSIQSRTKLIIEEYDEYIDDLDLSEDYFEVSLPEESINDGVDWSVTLQSHIGWLLDFEGWENSGEQGIF